MAYLQPYLVFKSEATRLNTLYWSSKYSYVRSAGILKLMADTGSKSPDPRVSTLWGSVDHGQYGVATVALSEFIKTLDDNAEALRTTSILQMCSAFETAICGYFALCCLYEPQSENLSYSGAAVPDLLKSPAKFESRKLDIIKSAKKKLKGVYTHRVDVIISTWGLPQITSTSLGRLNSYYAKRNIIAHDQGLASTDAPDHSAKESVESRLRIDEPTWKAMISDFDDVLTAIDGMVKSVAADGGLALAIYRIIDRDGAHTSDELKGKIQDEWRTGTIKASDMKQIVVSIGLNINRIDDKKYRISR